MNEDELNELKELQLNKLAIELKDAFRRKKSARDRKPYRPHPRFDTVACWLKTAKLVRRLNANAEDFIEAQFRFAKSTIFANTLHGPTAEKRYRQFLQMSSFFHADELSEVDVDTAVTPGKAELSAMISNAMTFIQQKAGTTNFLHPDAIKAVQETPWLFDPVTVMLMAGQVAIYKRLFAEAARQQLVLYPHLRRAAEDMGMDLEPIYNDTASTPN